MSQVPGCVIRRAVQRLTCGVEKLVALLLAVMAGVLMLEVALRFFAQTSLPWASEFARYAMVWVTFLGAALAVRDREHIRVAFFVALLPQVAHRNALIAINFVLLAFLILLLRLSIEVVEIEMTMRTSALDIPFGWVVMAAPAAGVLMVVYLLADTGRLFREGTPSPDDGEPGP